MTHLLVRIVEFGLGALAACGCGYYALCLYSARAFLRARREGSNKNFVPPVSILKPLRGADRHMMECFRSHCRQNYPEYEIIFGVSEPDDPAIALVEHLRREFPERRIEVIYCEKRLGTNLKVSNLAQMLPHARFEHVVVNDSDIMVGPEYLRKIISPFEHEGVGMVSAPYRGAAGCTLWSKLEALGISTDFMAGVLSARVVDGSIRFGLGSTLKVTRQSLAAIGGFEALLDYLADDYELGKRIADAGFEVVLSDEVVDTFLPDYNFAGEWWHIELLEDAAARLKGRVSDTVPVHLKLNTGMNRAGMDMKCLSDFLATMKNAEHVVLEGVFSHLASAEVLGAPDVDAQLTQFDEAVDTTRAAGFNPVYRHIANSAAIATRDNSWHSLVRPGISLYGYYLPFTSIVSGRPDRSFELPVKPVLSWKTRIVSLRELPERQRVGYNGAYVTQSPALIGMIPVGYGDGLSRQLSCRGRVIVRDDYASIAGNVSMDLTLIDVTGIPGVSVGDEVTLLGATDNCEITAWEHANFAMTIPYEILCNISKRVPRKYVE